jgi:anti-sigma regulatory factor (Ser/Thr protein kinase)
MPKRFTLTGMLTVGSIESALMGGATPEDWEVLDLSSIRFARSDALLLLVALCDERRRFSDNPLLLFPPKNSRVLAYLTDSAYLRLLATSRLFANVDELIARLPSTSMDAPFQFIPRCHNWSLQRERFESDCAVFLNRMANHFAKDLTTLRTPPCDVDELWHATKEIYENVFTHSQSWGGAALQYFNSPRPTVLSCCVDTGVGIRASLEPHYAGRITQDGREWNDSIAILEAIKDGVSSRSPSDEMKGYGLGICHRFAKRLGWLYVRSGSAGVLFQRKRAPQVITVRPVRGTLVVLAMGGRTTSGVNS